MGREFELKFRATPEQQEAIQVAEEESRYAPKERNDSR